MRTRDYDDDDDDNFETTPSGARILRDGGRARVSLLDARDARASHRLHDGRGNPVGHRPGFVVSDATTRDAREEAYQNYETDLCDAYRNVDARESKSDSADDRTLTMDQVYAQYDTALREAWRTPR